MAGQPQQTANCDNLNSGRMSHQHDNTSLSMSVPLTRMVERRCV